MQSTKESKGHYLYLETLFGIIAELNSIIETRPYLILKEKTTVKEKILSEKQIFLKTKLLA